MRFARSGVLMIAGLVASAVARGGEGPRVVVAGPLTIEVHVSETAHLFHVVDQLSGWSPYCHAQYRRAFEGAAMGGLSGEDRAMLRRHAEVRGVRGWGGGLEQAFYTDLGLELALKAGVAAGHLSPEQAEVERAVFDHFRDRVARLIREQASTLDRFRDRIEADREPLAAFAAWASRFFGGAKVVVPVYLIANPSEDDIGGGFNGGRLTLEVPTRGDAYPSFLHELFHAFTATAGDDLRRAAEGVAGLDAETLNEGLAYALAPGLRHAGGKDADPLRARVAADLAAGRPLSDRYARYNRFGLALRPLLREALDDPSRTIGTFLPRAVDAWKSLAELSLAVGAQASPARPAIYSFGPGWEALSRRLIKNGGPDLFGRRHDPLEYRKFLARAKAGETLVFLFVAGDPDAIRPEPLGDLLPTSWAEVEAKVGPGRPLELAREARGLRVVILGAATLAELDALIGRAKSLD